MRLPKWPEIWTYPAVIRRSIIIIIAQIILLALFVALDYATRVGRNSVTGVILLVTLSHSTIRDLEQQVEAGNG